MKVARLGFILLSALFPSAKHEAKLESPSKEVLSAQIGIFSHVIFSNIYNYAPLSYEKVKPLAKKSGSLKETLSSYTPSKIAELVKPTITFKLEEPTEESQVKKFKQKQKALEEISVCAFLHAVFAQFYPQTFLSTGNPQKPEVRIASNLPEWQIVKKVDVQRQEPKEVFMTLANIYHSIHNKYPAFSSQPLQPIQAGRKSYSTLLELLQGVETGDFAAEWKAFEAFNAAGFPPVPSTETIGELYPELKIPKPRGNFGKKK